MLYVIIWPVFVTVRHNYMQQQPDFNDNEDDSWKHDWMFQLVCEVLMCRVLEGLISSLFVSQLQNLLLLNPTERFLTEQCLNHHAFQTLRMVERPGPPTPTPVRSAKRKPHHSDNTTPSRSAGSGIVGRSILCLHLPEFRLCLSICYFLCGSEELKSSSNDLFYSFSVKPHFNSIY